MGHFVADNGAHPTVVEGVVGLCIEEGRLENAGGKDYLVNLWIVVGIDNRGRHTPLHSVDRFSNLIQVATFFKTVRAKTVVDIETAINLQRLIVAPFILVIDLVEKCIN